MTTASPLTTDDLVATLRASLHGDVVTPDDASYPAAAFGLDLSEGRGPDLVVIAADAGDAAGAVRLASRAGRRVVVQATGHRPAHAEPGTILIVTRLLGKVRIDPIARTASVQAGTTWRQVLAAAEPFGLAPVRSAADEPLARTIAFAADHIRELEVVTALGELIKVDRARDPAMFAAMRRGSAPFGLVTAATIELVPLARLYAGGLWFPAAAAAVVLRRWLDWVADLPATAASSFGRVNLPASAADPGHAGVPSALGGRSTVVVGFAHVGDPAVGAQLISAVREAWTPLLDTIGERSYGSPANLALGAAARNVTERSVPPQALTPADDRMFRQICIAAALADSGASAQGAPARCGGGR